MAYAIDLKSIGRKVMRVRLPPCPCKYAKALIRKRAKIFLKFWHTHQSLARQKLKELGLIAQLVRATR